MGYKGEKSQKITKILNLVLLLIEIEKSRNSLVVQWLGLCASNAGGTGLIPGQGTKMPHAAWHGRKTNKQTKNPKNKGKKIEKYRTRPGLDVKESV